MKKGYFTIVFALLLTGLIIQGCGSSDFTSAKVKEQNGDYKEAAKYYEKELKINPTNHEAWFRLGRIKGEKLEDYDGMTAAFREAEKLSSENKNEIYRIRYTTWANHLRMGDEINKRASADSMNLYDQAIEEYKKAITIWPDTSLSYYFLAHAYLGKGDISNATLCHKKIWDLDHDVIAYKQAGRGMIEQGLRNKEKFRSMNADGLRIQKNLKDIDKGSYQEDVVQLLGKPDNTTKDKKNPRKTDWIYKQYGITLTLDGAKVISKKVNHKIDLKIDSSKYQDAIADFNNAVNVFEEIKKLNPKDNENLNLLLQAYYEADRIQEATDVFKLAVENDPGNKTNHYILGLLYRMVNKNDAAIEEFNKAVTIDPNFSDAFYDIGATYYNWGVKIRIEEQEKGDESKGYKKKFEAALPWMLKVTEIKMKNAQEAASKEGKEWYTQILPEDIRIWESVGTIYTYLGKAKEAEKAYDEVEKIKRALSK